MNVTKQNENNWYLEDWDLAEENSVNEEVLDENSNKFRRVKKSLFGDPTGRIKTFAIISVENPLGWKNSTEEEFKKKYLEWTEDKTKYNKDQILKAKSSVLLHKIEQTGEEALKYGGFTYVPIEGSYGEKENSYLIINLSYNDAKTIARDFGQEAFFYGEPQTDQSTIYYFVTFDGCKTYKQVDVTKTVTYEEEAEDFFSKYGFKFKINLRYFGADIPEVVDNKMFEESLNDENSTFISRALCRKQAYLKGNDKNNES